MVAVHRLPMFPSSSLGPGAGAGDAADSTVRRPSRATKREVICRRDMLDMANAEVLRYQD